MAVDRQRTQQWREQNSSRRYPFADGAGLKSSSGFVFPMGGIVDAVIQLVGAGAAVYMSSIEVNPRLVRIWFGDAVRSKRASGLFDPLNIPEVIDLVDEYGEPAGLLVFDQLTMAELQTWSTKEHPFSLAQSEMAPAVVISLPHAGITGVLLEDGTLLAGDIWLVGEDGVVIRDEEGTIRVDVVGEPLHRRKLCVPEELFSTPKFVTSINGVLSLDGRFSISEGENLTADNALRVVVRDGTLVFEVQGRSAGS